MTFKVGQNLVFNVKDYPFNARGDGLVDDTAAINAAMAAAAAVSGVVFIPSGLYRVVSTISIPSGVSVEGTVAKWNGVTPTIPSGSWLKWGGGSTGTVVSMLSVSGINIERIGILGAQGGNPSTVVGLYIAGAPGPSNATTNIHISRIQIAECDTCVLWGDGVGGGQNSQADNVVFEHCQFIDFTTNGMHIQSVNAADTSTVRSCDFVGISNTTSVLIDGCGFCRFLDCDAGDAGVPGKFFKINGNNNSITIQNCEDEGHAYFLYITGADDGTAVTLIGNTINAGCYDGGIQRVIGIGNVYLTGITLDHPGAKWLSIGDRFLNNGTNPGNEALNQAKVTVLSGGIFSNQDTFHAAPTGETWNAGQITWQPGPEYSAETGIVGEQCIRSGFRAQVWNPNTVYATGSIVQPTVDNGHIFINLGSSGTSNSSEPVWNTGTGSTTSDNTVTWTEDGYSGAFAGFGPLDHYTGTAAPTFGFYRRGSIVWNTTPSSGSNVGWVNVAAGNPGTWEAFGNSNNSLVTTTINYVVSILGNVTVIAGTLTGPISVTLPATPFTGQEIIVKDGNGSAFLNNISILGNGHNIDGSSSPLIINSNFGSFAVIYSGTQWNII